MEGFTFKHLGISLHYANNIETFPDAKDTVPISSYLDPTVLVNGTLGPPHPSLTLPPLSGVSAN